MDARLFKNRINLIGPWLKNHFQRKTVKVGLDAGLGCPNRDGSISFGGCSFCPPLGAGKGLFKLSPQKQLKQGIKNIHLRFDRMNKEYPAILAYFQAYSATYGKVSLLSEIFNQALDTEYVDGLIISTRPDCLDAKRMDLLEDLHEKAPLMWLELGLQTCHDQTLKAIGRGHDVKCFDRAINEAYKRNIPVVAHVILGLPGENLSHTHATANYLAQTPVWGVKMHNLMVLKGSRLAKQWQQNLFTPWPMELWVEAACEFLARLPYEMLVHRLVADAAPQDLLAPSWGAGKDKLLTALGTYFNDHDRKQGDLYQAKPTC